MFSTAKSIAEYIAYLLPYRKTKWGLAVASLPILALWVLYIAPLYLANKNLFLAATGGCSLLFILISVVWAFHSRRIIIGNDVFTIVLALKANNPKSNEYIQNAIKILKSELDKLGLLGKFRILLAGQDVIANIEEAHRYRERYDLDLVIWGEVFSGKKDDKDVSDFKGLFFTYKIPSQVTTANLTELFKTDINIALVNRDWNVYEFNSLPDIEKISGHLAEVIMFTLGVIYCQTGEYAEDSIVILERLFGTLENKSANEKVEISTENKTLTMSPTVFRKSRVLGILLSIYKNIGLYFTERRSFSKAQFYLNKYLSYKKNDVHVLGGLALCSFFLDDYESSKKYTEEIGRTDKLNQVYMINKAFFGIWDENYDSALHFYKEFIKRGRIINMEIVVSVIGFLDDRKRKDSSELAYDFALGLLNYTFLQRSEGEKELRKFLKAAKNKPEYRSMVTFLQNDIVGKRKKR